MTELQTLKKKKKDGKASAEDLVRLKTLQDGEPLSAADLEAAKQREADRKAVDKAEFADRQKIKAVDAELRDIGPEAETAKPVGAPQCFGRFSSPGALDCTTKCSFVEDCIKQPKTLHAQEVNKELRSTTLDQPAAHPRITALKTALLPFTQIEVHSSRQNEFVLFTRGVAITAGDVRKARDAMKI